MNDNIISIPELTNVSGNDNHERLSDAKIDQQTNDLRTQIGFVTTVDLTHPQKLKALEKIKKQIEQGALNKNTDTAIQRSIGFCLRKVGDTSLVMKALGMDAVRALMHTYDPLLIPPEEMNTAEIFTFMDFAFNNIGIDETTQKLISNPNDAGAINAIVDTMIHGLHIPHLIENVKSMLGNNAEKVLTKMEESRPIEAQFLRYLLFDKNRGQDLQALGTHMQAEDPEIRKIRNKIKSKDAQYLAALESRLKGSNTTYVALAA